MNEPSSIILSLKRNIIASYASQIYVTLVGILLLPLYIKYMGSEAYGLVGFFTMLQAWFALLDLGLTPTIGRETARYRGGAMSALAFRQLFRALSLLFAGIAVIGGGCLWLLSEVVATRWLNVSELPISEVVLAVQIMAISVALRWMGGLYRGVVAGSECLVWLGGFNAVIASLRFIAVFASMWLYGFTPFVFFLHQLAVALLEVAGLFLMSSRLLPTRHNINGKIGWSFVAVKPVLKFALTIAFTSSVWILVTQTDKLILSGILSLTEYGYYTLAVLVASGIMVISGPISTVIMPRMAKLHAEGKHDELLVVYRNSTQMVSVICGSAAITIAYTAESLLYAWTGDRELAVQAAPILRLYAIGNGFLALAAFPYYLQYALGNLRYHIIGNVVMVMMLVPSVIVVANHYGGVGAGWVWLIFNALFIFFWVSYVHIKLEEDIALKWLVDDVVKITLAPILLVILLDFYELLPAVNILEVLIVAVLTLTIAFVSSGFVRKRALNFLKSYGIL